MRVNGEASLQQAASTRSGSADISRGATPVHQNG